MRIGIIACDILKLELEKILDELNWSPPAVFLDAAQHVDPQSMRTELIKQINAMAAQVDAVLLGYGTCQSLEGIEDACDVQVILPKADDCISLLLGPEQYALERQKEAGTWFMTPGWAEVGADMVIKELHLDRVKKYGKDPMEMARRLFADYRRGLFIDTGVGDKAAVAAKAGKFCVDFNLTLEETTSDCDLLRQCVLQAYNLYLGKSVTVPE